MARICGQKGKRRGTRKVDYSPALTRAYESFFHNSKSLALESVTREAERREEDRNKHGPVRVLMVDGKPGPDAYDVVTESI